MNPTNQGKTLWEMLCERLRGQGNGSGIRFYNPLDWRVRGAVEVPYANGPEAANYDFLVEEIREYMRRLGGQDYPFTDYVLRGVSTKSFAAEDNLTLRVRVVPNQAGSRDALLLRLVDEFAFAQDFLEVVKDPSGIFEVTDDQSGAKETFTRLNGLRESYEAAVMVIKATTPDGKAAPGQTAPAKLEYWDYGRESESGGHPAREFLFVEINSDTGWFQIWRGREYFA